ncbi:bifunctional 2-keto-4-hydroxyglutarate aldolase/2-keto-3-deoxy-6-phosphogluconate aldolase [Enterococcus dongliensis]|uniref:bifunctional 2-keto-4-hydroxyglutarate aldolase/2-keto-3-deoxy-6-phosphogluconate aldolase n=1 Tax=Enterococcus dongliensis TaxID=2559925 RepID=UPI00288E1529|nr:bifunctional 2-keto-4-hydroxyglutarate aldolase/2-keto-3-deoxy-6-phosphogluconate aldolase [Enterococcus dongliensis]MDT2612877.1 bifunctional 2-keto-4-hydroxyglutarate aldolase/2-keto-3-deoxy-6-phosphogluconate aldolase [Enterococcus dongliensis]
MKRVKLLNKLEKAGVIAVIRGDSKEQGKKSSEALIKGGLKGLEITFTLPEAAELITELIVGNDDCDVIIGAGTVMDVTTARLAIMAGAEFIVSPTFDRETAEICNLYQIPYLPGCMTITEIKDALKIGVDIIKLFPGSAYGPSIISAFKAPLPQVNIMPTGGVSKNNMKDWFKAGVVAVGVGGNLLKPAETGNYAGVTEAAREYMLELKTIREEL